jgi:MFS superfamily sulfate permease-like transporter
VTICSWPSRLRSWHCAGHAGCRGAQVDGYDRERFIRIVARPACEVQRLAGLDSSARHPAAKHTPGVCLFCINSPIVFSNARYSTCTARKIGDMASLAPRWFVLDAMTVTGADVTGCHTLMELRRELAAPDFELATAGRHTQTREWFRKRTG